jgi:hypothetical protein
MPRDEDRVRERPIRLLGIETGPQLLTTAGKDAFNLPVPFLIFPFHFIFLFLSPCRQTVNLAGA